MAANEDTLGELHTKVATVLSELLDGTEIPSEGEDGETTVHKIPPSAAVLQVAAKFLKDNNVTCTPSKDNALGALQEKMLERNKAREARREASKSDLSEATSQMSFMSGLPN